MIRFKKFLSLAIVSLTLLMAEMSFAQGSGARITFTIRASNGSVISQATINAQDAQTNTLASFFAEVRNAISEVLNSGAAEATRTVAISATVTVEITGAGMTVADGEAQDTSDETKLLAARKKVIASNPDGFVSASPN